MMTHPAHTGGIRYVLERLAPLASFLRMAPLVPVIVIATFILMALFADFIAPHDPIKMSLPDKLLPPVGLEGGTWSYPLGTDDLGRDILSRMIHGARISLAVAFLALTVVGMIGTGIGLISGYYGGRVDSVLMRAADVTLSFPLILFALLLAVTLGPSFINVVIAIGLVLWARYARVVRGDVLSVKERDFIASARISGCSNFKIIVRHIFPNILNTLLVLLTFQVGWVIMVESSLSFLGAGIPPPTPSWGSMVAEGRQYVTTAWWVSVIPGIAIALAVLAFNMFGDWLRDTLDPRLRQV